MSIFCIGQSAYDITIPIEEPIVENQKYVMNERFECGGGPACNSAYLCALWGTEATLISRIGNDEYGEKLKTALKTVGVSLEHIIEGNEIETPYSFIFSNVKNGTRTLFNYPGKPKKMKYQFPKKEPDVILSDGHEPDISVAAIAQYPNAISIVDAGTCRESTMKVAKVCDYIVCSEDFARQYTGKQVDLSDWDLCLEIFQEIEKIHHGKVVITLGDQGLLYKENAIVKHLPAYKVHAVDTNGAGDIFHGAFAYGISQQMKFVDILKLSSMAAALSTKQLGGQTSIPTLEKVLEKLKENEEML